MSSTPEQQESTRSSAVQPDPARHVMQVATGYIASAALYVAVQLNIADQVGDGAKSAEELARATGANEEALYRVLRLLCSLGIFAEVAPRRFTLSAAAAVLRSGVPGSVRDIAAFLPDPTHLRVYANLLHSVTTGAPAALPTFGMAVFEYLAKHPEYSAVFNDAMTAISAPNASAVVEAYDFGRYALIVDVGGGHGEILISILQKCPGVRGVLAEIDHVAEGAKARIARAGLAGRCQAVVCDFLRAVPDGGDAYVMQHIIHDWDDAHASTILRNIARAMGPKRGTVILLESVIASGSEPDMGKFIDIEMLAFTGGRERSAQDFRALLADAGFTLTRIVPTKSSVCVIEAVRD